MLRNENEKMEQLTRKARELEEQLRSEQSQVNSLVNVNEELRSLFEQERTATGTEHHQLQDQFKSLELQTEKKFKIIKSKLFVVIGAFALDRQLFVQKHLTPLDQDSSVDDLIQRIQDYAQIKTDKENQNPRNYSTTGREKQSYILVENEAVDSHSHRQSSNHFKHKYNTHNAVSSTTGRSDKSLPEDAWRQYQKQLTTPTATRLPERSPTPQNYINQLQEDEGKE